MNWEQLYSYRRSGEPAGKARNPDMLRTSFMRDYDRLIFSSAFRRLQNKTQVFPLPGAVFVHNRLTHSLEVASVGRSLGRAVGEAIAAARTNANIAFQDFYRHELQSVIAAACLAHDIGNPPFGHSGEDAIREFFENLHGRDADILHQELSPNQWRDFTHFEGNANAFRVLTHAFNEPEPGGYRLTYTTLAAIVKYPCSSLQGFDKKNGGISTKKSGFFDSERSTFESLAGELGILAKGTDIWARHPFVWLTEAADDICYRVIDLEDAHRLRIVSLHTFLDLFLPFFDSGTGYQHTDSIRNRLNRIADDNQKVQFVRASWIGLMVQQLTQAFMAQEAEILEGRLQQSLLDCLPDADKARMQRIQEFSVEAIYNHRSVLEIEVAGFNIIGALLEAFIKAALTPQTSRAEKLLLLLPQQHRIRPDSDSVYERVQKVVDFIAGMTDLYAIDLYRKITGISVPEIR